MNRSSFAPSKIDEKDPEADVPSPVELTSATNLDIAERYVWLEAMIDHIPDFIFAKDLQGRFLFGNKALIKNNGLGDISEIIGKTDFDFLPEAAAQSVTDIENRVAETGQADLGFEEMAEMGDKDRWLMMSRVPLRNTVGEIIGVVGASRDITVRKSAERLMAAQAHLLEIIARGSPLSVFVHELAKTISALKIGLIPAVLLASGPGRQLWFAGGVELSADYIQSVDASGLCLDAAKANLEHAEAVLSNIFAKTQSAHQPHFCRCLAIPGADGEVEGLLVLHIPAGKDIQDWAEFLAIIGNMTGIAVARNRSEEKIRFLAEHDALTGLANRSLFDRQLTEAVSGAKARKTETVLAFLDLDDFKLVNDTLGHSAGDELLKIVANRILRVTRANDMVARIGGDEFVVILNDVHADTYLHKFSRIHEAVAAPVILDGVELQVSCSIGLASFPSHGASAAELLMSADVAMYHAKQSGRNCIKVYDATMAIGAKKKLSRTEELRQALNRNEFELHFQPQQNQRSGKIVGVEALIRWNHPTEGLVFPNDFIPLAEETGLIVDIGGWVAAEACRIGKGWQDQGLEPVRISINVSARQFQERQFVKTISHALSDSGLDACWLEVEVTESLIMSDLTGSIAKMNELTELGVSLAVDDFGTGYSSLSVLKKFPLSRLKIDRSFITDIPSDQDDMSITSAIISLAQKLGLAVIAEGVETEDQAKFLVESGCHEIQGYLFSRPVSETAFIQMLRLNDELDVVEPLVKVA